MQFARNDFLFKIPGVLAIGVLALLSYFIHLIPMINAYGISSLVIAIVLGMFVGNVWQHPASWDSGVKFSAKRLLRLAIILYGFRLSYQQIVQLGWHAFALDCFIVISTLCVGYFVGRKLFKLDSHLALLISAGAAICGAAAVLAMEDVLRSEPYKAVVAVGTVVLFGTLSMFVYPFLQHADILGLTAQQFGVFAGSSIHEVAQVMVAGADISPLTGDTAVVVKMMRVLLLVPVLFVVAFMVRSLDSDGAQQAKKIHIPWFAVGFVIVIVINSLHWLSVSQVAVINLIDTVLLTMAMGAIGIETKFSKIRHVGLAPLYLAAVLAIWLFASAYFFVSGM